MLAVLKGIQPLTPHDVGVSPVQVTEAANATDEEVADLRHNLWSWRVATSSNQVDTGCWTILFMSVASGFDAL